MEAFGGERVLRLQAGAALAQLDGDYELLEAIASGLVEAPAASGFDATARTAAQGAFALAHLGAARSARGELDEADALLGAALDLSRRAGLRTMAASVLGELALLEAGRGRLRRSAELATDAVEDAELGGLSAGTPLVGAELALGWTHLLWDDLTAAEHHLDRAAAAADVAGDRRGRLAAAALLSLARGARGPREAGAALAELRGRSIDLDGWRPPQALAPILETAEARLLRRARRPGGGARRARPKGGPDRRHTGDLVAPRQALCSPRASPKPRSRSSSVDRQTSWTSSASGSRPAC